LVLNKKGFLPSTSDELKKLGWKQCDTILVSADAYTDNPFVVQNSPAPYLDSKQMDLVVSCPIWEMHIPMIAPKGKSKPLKLYDFPSQPIRVAMESAIFVPLVSIKDAQFAAAVKNDICIASKILPLKCLR